MTIHEMSEMLEDVYVRLQGITMTATLKNLTVMQTSLEEIKTVHSALGQMQSEILAQLKKKEIKLAPAEREPKQEDDNDEN